MENKSILIQSDEVTQNIMSEIQEDMLSSLSKISMNVSDEVINKLKPLEKKINEIKIDFQEFKEDDFEEQFEGLSNNLKDIKKSIENTIDAALSNVLKEQNKILFGAIEERLAILGLKVVKDAANNKEALLNEIANINFDKISEKVELIEKSIEEKSEITQQSIQQKVELAEKSLEENLDCSKMQILDKINCVNNKLDERDVLVECINMLEGKLNNKIEELKEEVEWGNKSFFKRIFGKRR